MKAVNCQREGKRRRMKQCVVQTSVGPVLVRTFRYRTAAPKPDFACLSDYLIFAPKEQS